MPLDFTFGTVKEFQALGFGILTTTGEDLIFFQEQDRFKPGASKEGVRVLFDWRSLSRSRPKVGAEVVFVFGVEEYGHRNVFWCFKDEYDRAFEEHEKLRYSLLNLGFAPWMKRKISLLLKRLIRAN